MIEPLVNKTPQLNIANSPRTPQGEDIEKQIETVFLNELLKNIFEQTEFGKNKTISPYIPFFTAEMSKSFAERGIGVGDFLTRNERIKQGQIAGPLSGRTTVPLSNRNILSEPTELKVPLKQRQQERQFIPEQEKNTLKLENISPSLDKGLPITLQLPAEGRISSQFGLRIDPFEGRIRQHNGIDIALKEGTEIKASAPGRVIFSGEARGYGKVVIIEHEGGFSTLYGHNSSNIVKKGDLVKEGQLIAFSGSTGRATGPHLHFEVRKDGEAVDPSYLFG